MQQYIGVKIVRAEPATDEEVRRGVDRPDMLGPKQKPLEPRSGFRVVYPDGYESWSPKESFEKAYRPTDGMTFGLALEALKKGQKVARDGWNGKGMFVVYQKAYPQGINCNGQTADAWGMKKGDLFRCEPYLQIKMANGSHAMWVPSINDCLAEDWKIVQ